MKGVLRWQIWGEALGAGLFVSEEVFTLVAHVTPLDGYRSALEHKTWTR